MPCSAPSAMQANNFAGQLSPWERHDLIGRNEWGRLGGSRQPSGKSIAEVRILPGRRNDPAMADLAAVNDAQVSLVPEYISEQK